MIYKSYIIVEATSDANDKPYVWFCDDHKLRLHHETRSAIKSEQLDFKVSSVRLAEAFVTPDGAVCKLSAKKKEAKTYQQMFTNIH